MKRFFSTTLMPNSLNSTALVLIPKKPGAASLSEFRHISSVPHLQFDYTSTSLSFKDHLAWPYSPKSNSLCKRSSSNGECTLSFWNHAGLSQARWYQENNTKIDLAKAFDSLRWDFLLSIIKTIDILPKFLEWCKRCLCNLAYFVSTNGFIPGYFKGKAGLRQGDPLSPSLFFIAINVLSIMLNMGAGIQSDLTLLWFLGWKLFGIEEISTRDRMISCWSYWRIDQPNHEDLTNI